MTIATLLAGLDLFHGLGPSAIAAMAVGATERRYRTDDRLFSRGDAATGLTLIVSGRVKVVREWGSRPYLVHVEGVGGTLGDVPVFGGGSYPATAIAMEPTHCVVVDRTALRAVFEADPGAAFVLLARLAGRVRTLLDRLDMTRNQRVDARLAAYLLARAGQSRGARFSLGMTQAALAEALGTVREVVVRELARLRRRRAIGVTRAGIVQILDRAALEAVVNPPAGSSRRRSSSAR